MRDHLELRRAGRDVLAVVRVEQRKRRGGVDLARLGVHDHGAAAVGGEALLVGQQAVLHVLLQLDVHRYDDVLAVHGRRLLVHAAGDGRAVAAALGLVAAGLAGQDVVVVLLQAA